MSEGTGDRATGVSTCAVCQTRILPADTAVYVRIDRKLFHLRCRPSFEGHESGALHSSDDRTSD
jgi:hypothetical protein